MANEIQTKNDARATFTITLASLAAGAGRQSDMITNTNQRPGAIVYLEIQSGTAPTAGTRYDVYLLRGDGTSYVSDGGGASDAAITIENAVPLCSIVVTNTLNKTFYREIDTLALGERLGAEWGIAVVNNTNQALNASGHTAAYRYHLPEIQ